MPVIRRPRGSVVDIEVDVVNALVTPPEPLNPNEGVFITLYDDGGDAAVDTQPMVNLWPGRYRYLWQTTSDHAYGVYERVIYKRHNGLQDQSAREPTVELVVP